MEHLFYVLWHDEVKPWLLDKLALVGWIASALALTTVIVMGWILLTIYIDKLVQGLYA